MNVSEGPEIVGGGAIGSRRGRPARSAAAISRRGVSMIGLAAAGLMVVWPGAASACGLGRRHRHGYVVSRAYCGAAPAYHVAPGCGPYAPRGPFIAPYGVPYAPAYPAYPAPAGPVAMPQAPSKSTPASAYPQSAALPTYPGSAALPTPRIDGPPPGAAAPGSIDGPPPR